MAELPEAMKLLAGKLGLTDKQLEALRKERGSDDAVMRWMKQTHEQLRDKPRLLGKKGGYTERQAFALRITAVTDTGREGEPEAVDAFTQKRLTADARAREQEAIGDLLVAMEAVRAALDDRVRANPEAAKVIGRELWQVRGRIDAAKARLKRRMAA